jgi:hypothetical protein
MEEDFALEYHLPTSMHCKSLCISLAHKGIFKLNVLYLRDDIQAILPEYDVTEINWT